MSKQKKYFWLKLKDDFFTDPKLKKLRRIAGGDTYTVIYLKMMLLSIKNGGLIEFQGIEKTLSDELSLILDEDEINVSATLIYLDKMCMIEAISEQSYLMQNVPELIGSESDSAERVRRLRANKALQCNSEVTECNTEKEIELEKEIDIIGANLEKSLSSTIIDEVIKYLNYKTDSKYKTDTPKTVSLIKARIKEGFDLKDFYIVIDKKVSQWLKNPKMVTFLRPETLFGTKFEGYLNEIVPTSQRMDISKLPEGVSLQDMLNEAGEQWEREQEQKQIGGGR